MRGSLEGIAASDRLVWPILRGSPSRTASTSRDNGEAVARWTDAAEFFGERLLYSAALLSAAASRVVTTTLMASSTRSRA